MSLDVTFTLEDIVEQLEKYEQQLFDAENAVQQIKGAIAACKHQMTRLAQMQTELVMKKAQSENQIDDCNSNNEDQQQQEQVL